MNVGNCKNANEKKVFKIAEGEEAKCPCCKGNMLVEVKANNKFVIWCVVALVIVGIVLVFLFAGSKSDEPTVAQEETETTVTEQPTPADSLETPEQPVVEVIEEPAPEAEQPAQQPAAKPAPAAGSSAAVTTYNLGWGTYDGAMQGGKPHDNNGTIIVKSAHEIAINNVNKDVVTVNKGDKIINVKARNGKIISGVIVMQDGRQVPFSTGVN